MPVIFHKLTVSVFICSSLSLLHYAWAEDKPSLGVWRLHVHAPLFESLIIFPNRILALIWRILARSGRRGIPKDKQSKQAVKRSWKKLFQIKMFNLKKKQLSLHTPG